MVGHYDTLRCVRGGMDIAFGGIIPAAFQAVLRFCFIADRDCSAVTVIIDFNDCGGDCNERKSVFHAVAPRQER